MPKAAQNSSNWTSTQAYLLAVICLLSGVVVGYLLRGSSPTQTSAPAKQAPAQSQESQPGAMGAPVTAAQLKRMADKQAEPLLNELKTKPTDAVLLAEVGNVYYDAQQFNDAIDFYSRSLQSDPKNTNVRTDLATALWYVGDADRAIAEFDRVLKQEPNKVNALFNRGMVKWQGKIDVKGAVADWETLLKVDPNYPQRPKVEQLILQAKKHSNIKPGEKTSKPTT
jgi:cytochrome c-type biogenesis protein CcmH/NrfG